nr:nucleoside-diphosphate sugar epimerase/dehydratase [Burkholderia sp. L27(2015)]
MLKVLHSRITSLPRPYKQALMGCSDAVLLWLAIWLAFALRFGDWFVPDRWQALLMAITPLIAAPFFVRSGLYRSVIRYVGEQVIWTVVRSMFSAALMWTVLAFFVGVAAVTTIPRSVPFIYFAFGVLLIGGSRFLARWILWLPMRKRFLGRQVLIYGADSASRQLATSLRHGTELFPVGFVDEDPSLQGQDIGGLRVYGPHQLNWLIQSFDIRDLIVTESSLSPRRRQELLVGLRQHPVHVRILPAISDIASGKHLVQLLRELEVTDLLGRDPVAPNPSLIARNITGKVVLVTGAGGSIGSELCRQILLAKPTKLLLVDSSEYNLYAIHTELIKRQAALAHSSNAHIDVELIPLLANVCDSGRMTEICRTWQPRTLYHAAAYKHVPLVEHNPAEGIRNNVFGTLVTAQSAVEHQVTDFVLVSSDKAVRPTNVMGASKRMAELLLQALANAPLVNFDGEPIRNQTRFSIVRFGNVLGSSGSVVPLFRQQIKEGGPITLTDPEVTRYFMTIPEAAQLVIQAGAMAEGGDVFVLDMGEPIRIIDLAIRMVELSGLTIRDDANPHGDLEILITGLRPGEKLYEELLIGESPEKTAHSRIMKAHEDFLPWETLKMHLAALRIAVSTNDVAAIRILLLRLVAGYQPHAESVDLVYLAENGMSLASAPALDLDN